MDLQFPMQYANLTEFTSTKATDVFIHQQVILRLETATTERAASEI